MLYTKLRIILKKKSDSGRTSTSINARTPKTTNKETSGTAMTDEIIPIGENEPSINNCTGIVASCAPAETANNSATLLKFTFCLVKLNI